jgi:hypothetical protein
MGEDAGGGETITVAAGDVGFGELASGEIGDLDVEVKWGCPCEEFCPGGDGCVLEVEASVGWALPTISQSCNDRPLLSVFHNNPCFVLFYFLVGSLIYDVGNAHPTVVFDLLQCSIGLIYDVGNAHPTVVFDLL